MKIEDDSFRQSNVVEENRRLRLEVKNLHSINLRLEESIQKIEKTTANASNGRKTSKGENELAKSLEQIARWLGQPKF